MKLSERSLQNPAAVAAAAAIVLLFGVLALLRLPIQLLPDTRQPELFVAASWREAAPAELEEAIVEPIEEAMRGLPGLVEMRSESNRGRGGVGLTFEVGTDMTRVMLDVVSRLNSLPPLPPDADEPQVFGGDNWQSENAASLLLRPVEGHEVPDIAVQYQQLVEEVVEPRLARVPGVSRVNLEGGRPREVRVTFDPHRLAALGITPQKLAQTVIAARDVSAGFADVGRRQFTVRVTGREPVEDLGDLVVGWSDDRPLYLRDVAEVRAAHVDAVWFAYRSGVPAYYITLQRTSDSNTVELIDGVKVAIAELNAGPLATEKLFLEMSWDASVYVRRAIGFVEESIAIGILLAVGGLWYFLRGPRALLVIGASIPISLFFAVMTLHALGRTLNVVSLALPALRERTEDIPRLIRHFVDMKVKALGLTERELAPDTVERLLAYRWPGNVRELDNVIERLLVLGPSDGPIGPEYLPQEVVDGLTPVASHVRDEVLSGHKSLSDAVDEFERDLIGEALTRTHFNQTRAATVLGTTRRILKYRMDKLGIGDDEDDGGDMPTQSATAPLGQAR